MNKYLKLIKKIDWVVLVAIILLVSLGLLLIYSTSASLAGVFDYSNLKKQILALVIGVALFIVLIFVDYKLFKTLFDDGVDCYILNTGHFMGKKVEPRHTLGAIEAIVDGTADFKKWVPFQEIEIMEMEGFNTNLDDAEYKNSFIRHFVQRISFVESRQTHLGGVDTLPAEAVKSLYAVISQLHDTSEDESVAELVAADLNTEGI